MKMPNEEGTYKANDLPYSLANRKLGQAQKTLARQQEEAEHKLKMYTAITKGYSTSRLRLKTFRT
jgi:hypothetical protein